MTTRDVALVFGATGYTGTAVVKHWADAGPMFAHVRPESKSLGQHADIFEQPRVHVERVPWEDAAIGELVARTQPSVVFGLLGTTRARAKQELTPSDRDDPYAAVDERLTLMAARAVQAFAPRALFVYLSAMGVTGNTSNRYILARHRVEQYLAQSSLRYVIARPALITGSDRGEFRLGERALAVVSDGVFDALAFTGIGALRTFRDKFSSLTGDQLGRALVSLGQSPPAHREVYPDELRRRSRELG